MAKNKHPYRMNLPPIPSADYDNCGGVDNLMDEVSGNIVEFQYECDAELIRIIKRLDQIKLVLLNDLDDKSLLNYGTDHLKLLPQ